MGIPAFFRWLSKKYPSIVVTADKGFDHGYTFDNFYLDMNGIIHPCTHPENKPPPETEEDMFEAIFEYIDMLLDMVKPTGILYMAIDGVAPRAKMNQQRSRRFRAAKESIEKKQSIEQIKDELRLKGVVFDESVKQSHFDSNVITPGTPFMTNLGKALRDWIDRKQANAADTYCKDEKNGGELRWPKDLLIILSDASVPGEGEHKIMDFVRKQKAQPDYNPNVRHCLCGADADLIMLGLATHELDFTILREEFVPNQPKACDICAQYGHETKECQGTASVPDVNVIKNMSTPFIYIRLCVLREYLEKECEDLDFERYIDDFVLLCFFVGNDFLPHLPSLEIRENAIDKLLRIYKNAMREYSHPKPYITDNGFVNLHKVQMVLCEFGKMEDDIFVRRKISDERYKMRLKKQKMLDHNTLNAPWLAPVPVVARGQNPERLTNVKAEATNLSKETLEHEDEKESSNQDAETSAEKSSSNLPMKRKIDESQAEDSVIDKALENENSDDDDDVQLWNSGWKERYYLHKFDCKNHEKISGIIVKEYVVGLCWVMRYYYQGCVDWQWYYPFHYAPFASDFKNIQNIQVTFERSAKPFRPLEQLMSVFPAASAGSLPPSWQALMKSHESSIIDFYPKNFKIDLNGKKQAWQGVALLPFIDEQRLFRILTTVYPDLTPSEVDRNQLGENLIFISKHNQALSTSLTNALENNADEKFVCDSIQLISKKSHLRKSQRYTDEAKNAFCFEFFDPDYEQDFVFPAKRLKEAILPERVLKPEDFVDNNNYNQRNQQNNNFNNRQFQQNRYNNNNNNNYQQPQHQQHHQQNRYNNNNNNNYQQQNRNSNSQHPNNSNNQFYRPVIGFTRGNQQARVGQAGRRMVNFHNKPNYNNNANFNNRQS